MAEERVVLTRRPILGRDKGGPSCGGEGCGEEGCDGEGGGTRTPALGCDGVGYVRGEPVCRGRDEEEAYAMGRDG